MAENSNGHLLERVVALLVDGLVLVAIGVVVGIVAYAAPLSGAPSELMDLIGPIGGLVGLIYFTLLEAKGGQTLGKKAMGIKVVNKDGTEIDMAESLIRNILRIVDYLPFFYILGIIMILVTDSGQRIGDLAAGTVVRDA